MSEIESPQPQESKLGARPAEVPLTARLMLRESLTARRPAAIIAACTLLITVAWISPRSIPMGESSLRS
jgi:hypothetical protein